MEVLSKKEIESCGSSFSCPGGEALVASSIDPSPVTVYSSRAGVIVRATICKRNSLESSDPPRAKGPQRGSKQGACLPFHDDEEAALAMMHVLIHVQDAHDVGAA